ncbi:hypothetical protein AB0758_44635 [Tolypothrix bouteillei VB521301_2]|uniref:Uncharacterized protein n=1 Tax=Tolypothrix bouteillei VB521301 TaxID=1479485 RepID=A0A0C1NLV4_9CYAN
MVCIAEAIVYVWLGDDIDDFGHASLNILGTDGTFAYCSFWPSKSPKKDFKHLWKTCMGYFPERYEEDCDRIERTANYIIQIFNLPNPYGYSIISYKSAWQKIKWDLTGSNCCYAVIENLRSMSGFSPPKSWHGIYHPKQVIKYAQDLQFKSLNKSLAIARPISYKISGSTVEIKVCQIRNNRVNGISGKLRLRLYAITSIFDGKNISGHVFAETEFQPLQGGYCYNNITKTVPYHKIITGKYHVILTLDEYDDKKDGWFFYDWVYFNNRITI